MHLFIYTILCTFITVQNVVGEYGDRIKNATITWGENLKMEESRHSYALAPYPPLDHNTELPVTFQAPFINARDYWNDPARRTGFDYNPYTLTKPITDGINTFYGMMNQFFGVEQPRRYPGPPYQPHPYDHLQQAPGRPYYIPQPKPIRAQIQKLEPSRTRFPVYQEAPVNPANYPQFVKILNDVLEENIYKHPEHVLEKPDYIYEYIVPTTYKPPNRFKYRTSTATPLPVSIQDKLPPVQQGENTQIPYVTETTEKQTPAVRPGTKVVFPQLAEFDQQLDYPIDLRTASVSGTTAPPILRSSTSSSPLPLAHIENSQEITTVIDVTTNGETGVQSVSTTPFPITAIDEITTTSSITISETDEKIATTSDSSVTPRSIPTTTELFDSTTTMPAKIFEEITMENISSAMPNAEMTSEIPSTLQTEFSEIRPVTELLHTMEPLERKRNQGPFPKKLHSRRVTTDSTTSADYVTDLTVQGLTDATAMHASVPRYLHTPNVSSVIGYVLNELNATAPPFDELSLDAKILQDTNWDGFQSTSRITTTTDGVITTNMPTTENMSETTTETEVPSTTLPPVTTTPALTTTEAQELPTTVEPSRPVEKEMIVATRMTQTVSRGSVKLLEDYPSPRHVLDDDIKLEEDAQEPTTSNAVNITSTSEATIRPRKYIRRQRVHSFTPKPKNETSTENPLRFTASRPFQPKRSRLNATLSFSNRANRRNDETTEKRPIRTEEEVKKIRNLYRRRNYPSPLRKSTSTESAAIEDE